jgi:acyl-coenzyme A thioesterase PaaI-like protein
MSYLFDGRVSTIATSGIIGILLGIQIQKYYFSKSRSKSEKRFCKDDAPTWLQYLFTSKKYKRVYMQEWEDNLWREKNGWKGRDLIHNKDNNAVFIPCYFYNKDEKILSGPVHFGKNCESHRGLCHGGSMTSVMDDICGHIAFLGSGNEKHAKPWKGATVQVNVKLKNPIQIGTWLCITGNITRIEKRKIYIYAKLIDANGQIYAEMDGLSISGVDLSNKIDKVSERVWVEKDKYIETSKC